MLFFLERASLDGRSSDSTRLAYIYKKKKKFAENFAIRSPKFRARSIATPSGYIIPAVESRRKFLGCEWQPQPRSFAAAFSHADGHCLVIRCVNRKT